jgi:hypothetical protein
MPRLSTSSSEDPGKKNVRPDVIFPLSSIRPHPHPLGTEPPTLGSSSRKPRVRAASRQTTPAQVEVLSWIEKIIVPALVENFIRMKSSNQENPDE